MNISVVIPTYNSSRFIRRTLDSVLAQTQPLKEVLVLDDGSTDDTVSILEAYRPKIAFRQQKNRGVAAARNTLCSLATGEIVAFLDHDDLWHPRYLETQVRQFSRFPQAAAAFTWHENFRGYDSYTWEKNVDPSNANFELIEPLAFFERYNKATGPFASMSYCCVSKRALMQIGDEPFRMSGVDDSHLCNLLSLVGPIAYCSTPLVAYRITESSQSKDPRNHVKGMSSWVEVFEMLDERFRTMADPKLRNAFARAFASKRRQYAKILIGAGRTSDARAQIRYSIRNSSNPVSLAKSIGLLASTYLPGLLQQRWTASHRRAEQGNV